jgi:competence protein ComEC
LITARHDIFPLAETTPLLRLTVWFILGIVTGAYTTLSVPLFLVALVLTLPVAFLLRRWPLGQSLTLALAIFLLGATLAARQRDDITVSGLTVRQWIQQQKEPNATTMTGRSRLFFLQQREKLLEQYRQQHLEDDTYALVAAMTLGDKRAVDKDLRMTYNVSGAAHVLALSGLHMGIIYTLLTLLTFSRRRRIVTQVITIAVLWTFVFLVGMPASAVRAATMLSLSALLTLGYREKASINALSFTALVMLIISPYTLFDIGFQMSFLAVLSILVWMPVIGTWVSPALQQRWPPVRWVWGLTAVTLAAQLGVAPLIAYYFGRFSTYFLLSSFVAIPAVTLIVWLALAILVIPPLSPLLTFVTCGLNTCLNFINRLPGASIEGLHPTLLQIVLSYILILCIYWLLCYLSKQRNALR